MKKKQPKTKTIYSIATQYRIKSLSEDGLLKTPVRWVVLSASGEEVFRGSYNSKKDAENDVLRAVQNSGYFQFSSFVILEEMRVVSREVLIEKNKS